MKIVVHKVGGVFGPQRLSAEIDTAAVPQGDRLELQGLLDAAGFWGLPSELPSNPDVRDELGTVLEVTDGERKHAVGFILSTAPTGLRDVVSKVRALARHRQG